ncbi:MAG: VOC family protein [Acidobacteria bacterium]|nr:VOC family protein [Acidobacteriota bacterium]
MPKVKPIPKGYHTVTTAVTVSGAKAFIGFCKKALGAKEVLHLPGPGGMVVHAELVIGDTHLMAGDEMPQMGNKSARTLGGSPLTLHVYVPNCDKAIAKAVKHGATVTMPASDQFWGDRYGRVVDPWGNNWAFATHIEDVTPREMKKRTAKLFGGA